MHDPVLNPMPGRARGTSSLGRSVRSAQLGLSLAWWTLMPAHVSAQGTSPVASPNPAIVAQTPGEAGSLDERVHRLASELRCMVCQNQTLADSQVELAVQLKHEIRRQLGQGASEQQVREFMVQRYGDVVLYRPPLEGRTAVLWAGPVGLLLAGLGLLVWHLHRRQSLPAHDEPAVPEGQA